MGCVRGVSINVGATVDNVTTVKRANGRAGYLRYAADRLQKPPDFAFAMAPAATSNHRRGQLVPEKIHTYTSRRYNP